MRHKLSNFTDFANTLYPHEVDYLLAVQQFNKPNNLKVVNLIHYNSRNPQNRLPFDSTIDKRTYSYLKTWITDTLYKADVDMFYDWLIGIERNVMSDSITPDEEKELLDQASITLPSRYYFLRFYQVMQHYRDYLMVRNRIRFYAQVTQYLETYNDKYVRSLQLNNEMNIAAERIVSQIARDGEEFTSWEDLFKKIYFDETIDGYTRYRAAVRLTILYYTNREFESLRSVYEHLDLQFKKDVFYSKRILANYYHNRAMMHSKLDEFSVAEKYGYLSIRQKNSDYLFYLVSLCGILLKINKNAQALKLMSDSIPELKNTNSYHSKIGFASFYIKTLSANNQIEKAISYGTSFFEAYKKEIFEYRWHLFFSSYMNALLRSEKYPKIISLSRRYKLVTREKQYLGKAAYLPVLNWYTCLSEYMEGAINRDKFFDTIVKGGKANLENKYQSKKILELLNDMEYNLPDELKEIKDRLGII
jgi:hypothetical protein